MNNLIRSEAELKFMRQSGLIAAKTLKKAIGASLEGVTLIDLDKIIEAEILNLGGSPAFKSVPGYNFASCLSLNDEVVHAVPTTRKLKEGDLLSIDLGVIFEGWYTDTAWSVLISERDPNKLKFLHSGEEAMWKAIKSAREGQKIGDISSAIQEVIEGAGLSVVKSLVGHGVGKSYHEEPEVPGFGQKGIGMSLKAGMTLAIEAIYTAGSGEVYEKADGWTVASADHTLSACFEMTVVVGVKQPEIITDWRGV